MPLRVLIAGGSGYLGRHLARHAVAQGWDVVNYDLSKPHLTFHPEKDQWIEGSLTDTNLLLTCFQCYPPDLVVHLALVRDQVPEEELKKACEVNVEGTRSLLWAMASVGSPRLIALSSALVYGQAKTPYLSEELPTLGEGPLGESLCAAEEMMLDFQEGLPGHLALLRLFETYGYGSDDLRDLFFKEDRDIFAAWKSRLRRGEPIELFGTDFPTRDGTSVRDFVHVEDVVKVIWAARDYMEIEPRLVTNVGLGKGYSQVDLIEILNNHLGESVKEKPRVKALDRRPYVPPRLVSNSEYLMAWCDHSFQLLKDCVAKNLGELSDLQPSHSDPQSAECRPHQSNPLFEAQRI